MEITHYCKGDVELCRDDEGIVCKGCLLSACADVRLDDPRAGLQHLHAHEAKDHGIPLSAFQKLRDELTKEGA